MTNHKHECVQCKRCITQITSIFFRKHLQTVVINNETMGIDGFLKETILAAFFGLVRSATTVGQTSLPLQKVSSVHQIKLIHRKTNTVLVVQVISPAVESCGQMRARSQLEQI